MSIHLQATLTLGALAYESQAVEVAVSLSLLPGIGSFRARLPARVEVSCHPGDPARLELDGGDGKSTVLTGKVRGVRHSFDAIEVWAADGAADLAALRPTATYTGQSVGDIMSALAADAGVSMGDVDVGDLVLAAYATHQRRTSAEHVSYLARLAGARAVFDGEGALQVRKRPSGPADAALLYGRELLSCRVRGWPAPFAARVLVGNGPAGSADTADALRPTAGRLPSDAPEPGAQALWEPSPVLRTPGATKAGASAAGAADAASGVTLSGVCFLQPQLRPGMSIEVQSLPAPLDEVGGGRWLLGRVSHRLRAAGASTTTFEGETASAAGGGFGGLLGAATQAIGGLL